MLEVKQLTRLYGKIKAVDNVSFDIQKGEIVGLLGHNGAGKTTIMKMLSGFIEPNQGSIIINGVDLQQAPKEVQQNLGYLSENLPIYPEMTVADYLDYASEMKGLKGENKNAEIRRVIQATDIVPKLLVPIDTLSRGYKQRVGIAQAILGRPSLLILDEPTNGLDPTQTLLVRALIRSLAKDATVILSTHIMQEVDALCSRALIIRDGKLSVDAKLADLRESNYLLLTTSLSQDTLTALLQPIKNITTIDLIAQPTDDVDNNLNKATLNSYQYRIGIKDSAEHSALCGQISSLIVHADGILFAINSEQRSLETLFREVNETQITEHNEEARNAA